MAAVVEKGNAERQRERCILVFTKRRSGPSVVSSPAPGTSFGRPQ
jgi:hypothetical protein